MKYDLEKAVYHFQKKFSKDAQGNYKPFYVTKNDVDHLNCILGWVIREKENSVLNHSLFAKLFIYHLTQSIRYNKATIFDDKLKSDIFRLLDYPLESFYQSFINDLYASQFNRLVETDSIKDANGKIVEIDQFKKVFNEDYIKGKLNDMISEALNRFNNSGTKLIYK